MQAEKIHPEDLEAYQSRLEFQAAYESGAAVLRSFLMRSPRPEGGVYALFALDPEGRLHYVCSTDDAFDSVSFPAEIVSWPHGEAWESSSTYVISLSQPLHDWVPGLPQSGHAVWHPLSSTAGHDGLLLLWTPQPLPPETLGSFQQLAQVAGPFFRIWQNDRRQRQQWLRLQALEELSLAVASSLDLKQVLLQTGQAVVGPLGFDRADLYVLDDEDQALRGAWSADSNGDRRDLSAQVISLEDTANPLVQVALGLKNLHLDQPQPGSRNGHSAPVRGIVPLPGGGRIVGAIALDNGIRCRSIREDQLQMLLPFAAHAGAAVHNARLHERLAKHLQQADEMESRRKLFEREVILSVTEGKLHLCERDEIDGRLGDELTKVGLERAADVGACRQRIVKQVLEAGLAPARRSDIELCVGEAATNCYQHAGGGEARLFRQGEDVQILVSDRGPGIHSFLLPRATLLKGYSTTTSLGMGFSLILSLCDRLYLSTGGSGTDVLIELASRPRSELDRVWQQLGLTDPPGA